MTEDNKRSTQSEVDLEDMVASSDSGSRNPLGAPGKLLVGVAAAWSLFQLWIASPLPFMAGVGVFNATEARSIHLAFALFLAFMAYPATKRSPRDRIPLQDWVLAILAASAGAYMFVFYEQLADRPGHLDLHAHRNDLWSLLRQSRGRPKGNRRRNPRCR